MKVLENLDAPKLEMMGKVIAVKFKLRVRRMAVAVRRRTMAVRRRRTMTVRRELTMKVRKRMMTSYRSRLCLRLFQDVVLPGRPHKVKSRLPMLMLVPPSVVPCPCLQAKSLRKGSQKHGRNYEVVNLKKMHKVDYIAKRNVDHYNERRSAMDPRFWSRVHQDIYESIILTQKQTLVPQRAINMKFFDENRENYPGVVDIIDAMGLWLILSFCMIGVKKPYCSSMPVVSST
jgi:hypothetical protein